MPAAAGDDREIIRTGNCPRASDWKLKVKADDGRIETQYEVDQNRNAQRWRVVLRHDGVVVFRGIRTTRAPSGSFEVEVRSRNRPRRDRITARAVNLRGGEICRGSATL